MAFRATDWSKKACVGLAVAGTIGVVLYYGIKRLKPKDKSSGTPTQVQVRILQHTRYMA